MRQRTVGETDPPGARPSSEMVAVWEQHIDEHPVIQQFLKTRDRRARTLSDYLPRNAYHRTGIYNEFYKHIDTEDQLGLFVAAPKPLMICVGLSRGRRSFTDRDRAVLDVMQPHILQAYRNAEAMADLHGGDAWAVDAIEASDQGAVWLATDGAVRAATAQARRWMAAYWPARVRPTSHAALPEPLRRWVDQTKPYYERSTSTDDLPISPTTTLSVRAAGGTLFVRLVPTRRGEGFLMLLSERADVASGAAEPPELAALAPRFRRVLRELLAGLSEKEAAAKLGLTLNTLHEYVKHIYATLGATSRGELLARWIGRGQ